MDNICDMVGNCNVFTDTDFKVVANVPDRTRTQATYASNSSAILVANLSDTHSTRLSWRDQFNNPVVPVTGVKELVTDVVFTNNLGSDQIQTATTGDGVDFAFQDGIGDTLGGGALSNSNAKKVFVFTGSNVDDYAQGKIEVTLKSAVPTKNEYMDIGKNTSIYGSLPANLALTSLALTPNALPGYTSVGQNPKFEYISTPVDFRYTPSIIYNKIESLAPLVEGREKEVTLERAAFIDSQLTSHQLFVQPITSNLFLRFQNINLEGVGLRNEKFYIGTGNDSWPLGVFATVDENLQDAPFTGTSKILKLTPRTIGGISNTSTEVGLSTALRYKLGAKYVQLPGVQTGFTDYDGSRIVIYTPDPTVLDPISKITLAELDIRGLTQSKNTGNVTTGSAVSKFQDFSTISIADLKTDVNKSVEKLLAGKDRGNGVISGGSLNMTNLDFASSSNAGKGIHLEKETIMYVKDTDVILDCGGVCTITGKRSLIIENGNLFIKSDMKYADTNSILGLVLIGNKDGNKNIVRISENITNGVGIVYSEGPIVSAR